MHVVGTAGHVDHGKSALVRALTGTDPDRWAEERRRGMTLDLGFAHLRLADGVEAGIVDVPGHERFLHNMLAGAAGMELLAARRRGERRAAPADVRAPRDPSATWACERTIVVLTQMRSRRRGRARRRRAATSREAVARHGRRRARRSSRSRRSPATGSTTCARRSRDALAALPPRESTTRRRTCRRPRLRAAPATARSSPAR